jgi:general secretion pathway protein G
MRRKSSEKTIFFPWERTGSALRRMGLARAKPLLWAGGIVGLFVLLGARERHAIGVRSTRATIGVVARAVDAYRADHEGSCPAKVADLRVDGYIGFEPADAWGRPLRLLCPGFANPDRYDLMSDGPDGIFGGLDRIE